MLDWIFEIEKFICIKMDLALNNQQGLIFYKTNQTKPIEVTKIEFLSNQNHTHTQIKERQNVVIFMLTGLFQTIS